MSGYDRTLPPVFKYAVVVEESRLAPVLAALLAPDSRFPNGSSFAVTTNVEDGKRKLWLSEASLPRVIALLRVATVL